MNKLCNIMIGCINDKIKLTDISKESVIYLSFTQNEGEEYINYLHNIIKNGAMYYVGENYGEDECPSIDLYDVCELDCWSENIEDEYNDVESMAEQLVSDFAESRWEEYEYDKGAMAICGEYTITIYVGDVKVFEKCIIEK